MTILDTFRLDGRVAIVTGPSSGLGVGFAKARPRRARTSRSARAVRSGWRRRASSSRTPDGAPSPSGPT
jgi:NAD(P)-dependent dehydrogenase (short-subunit alcohol dehydrogenase family)